MEHNHLNLNYGFLLSYSLFGMGLASSYFSFSGNDIHSKVTLIVLGIITIILAIICLKKTFSDRDHCEICKEKYRYGKKK